jgi:hypothetical protein
VIKLIMSTNRNTTVDRILLSSKQRAGALECRLDKKFKVYNAAYLGILDTERAATGVDIGAMECLPSTCRRLHVLKSASG